MELPEHFAYEHCIPLSWSVDAVCRHRFRRPGRCRSSNAMSQSVLPRRHSLTVTVDAVGAQPVAADLLDVISLLWLANPRMNPGMSDHVGGGAGVV